MPNLPKPQARGNYDHILTRLHRKMGYGLQVTDSGGAPAAKLTHQGKTVGELNGFYTSVPNSSYTLGITAAHLGEEHRRKGLGFRMYEALIGHAYHNEGVKTVIGFRHSAAAHAVHKKIAAKYGVDYKARDLKGEGEVLPMGNQDEEVKMTRGPYKYTFKNEVAW